MKNKNLKSILAFILSVVFVVLSIPSTFAVLSPKEEESYHTEGGLFLNVKADAPPLEVLFEGFEIEKADLIKTIESRPGYLELCSEPNSNGDEEKFEIIGYIYHIWLVDETKEMLEEAVDKLLMNHYVNGANVNNYKEKPQVPVTTPDEDKTPTTPTVPVPPVVDIPDYTEPAWYPGIVIVALKYNSPSVNELLEGFEIEEVSFLTDLGHSELFLVKLTEKNESVVGKAIKKLSTSPCVVSASPDYIDDWGKYEGDDVYWCAKRGDVFSDGKVDIRDATTIQKWLVGISGIIITGDDCDKYIMESSTVADVDFDGIITIKDATAIQKSIAGII